MPLRWKIAVLSSILSLLCLNLAFFYFLIFQGKIPILIFIVIEFLLILLFLDIYIPQINILSKALIRLKNKDRVVLSFDDGPDPEITPKLLELLKKYKIKANFFILGKRAKRYPEIVKRIREEGHEICSHGYSHKKVHLMKRDRFLEEIEETERIIESIIGERPRFYRAPHGFIRYDLYRLLRKKGYKIVAWSIGVWDTDTDITPETIVKRAKGKIKGGDIILLHDGDESYTRPQTSMLKALPEIINEVKKRGLSFVKLSELKL